MYAVSNHRLHMNGSPVEFIPSPNIGGPVRSDYLVLHYTAGTTAEGAIGWFGKKEAKASAHLVVDRLGAVTQLVEFNRVAWHAGKSHWNGIEGLNPFSIGIEIVNAGKLRRTEAGTWVNWAGNVIGVSEVVVLTHKDESSPAGWHVYTPEQILAVSEIAAALHSQYSFLDVLGHDDIAPKRKVDPGPAFPIDAVRSKVFGRA